MNEKKDGKETNINISISDTLTSEELQKIMQVIRDIEQNNPLRMVKIWIDSNRTTKEVEEMISSISPELPHKLVIDFSGKDNKDEMVPDAFQAANLATGYLSKKGILVFNYEIRSIFKRPSMWIVEIDSKKFVGTMIIKNNREVYELKMTK